MPEIILKVENISKQYRLGTIGTGTISHDLNRWWYQIRGKDDPYLKLGETNDRSEKGSSDYVWALKDINFEVKRGEVLGIIGKNGAGKSTLLKILSNVTSPTMGLIKSKGCIASLLEVGTGFHPEMTGRENIYLNGAILGMTKSEIKSKEDEIVSFSGCERYIDTPVKRYSSGMTVRLAFAVAAHLEPDILVVDEVLAVGDAEFQKKAIGKMQDISKGAGRTVLFVSHNMAAVKSLCSNAIVLQNGKLVFSGSTDESVNYYLKSGNTQIENAKFFNKLSIAEIFKLNSIKIYNKSKSLNEPLIESNLISLETDLDLYDEFPEKYHITYHLYNELGDALFSFTTERGENPTLLRTGKNILICEFPKNFFQPGFFQLDFYLIKNKKKAMYKEKSIFQFNVIDGGRELGVYMGKEPGFITPIFNWKNLINND